MFIINRKKIKRIFVRKFFCKLLSKYLWQSLYIKFENRIIKFHAFSIFFSTPLDGFVWSMRIILWNASYFRHSNNIHTARASLQKLLMELQWKWSLMSYLSNKEQKWTFLNVSRSDMHIDFDFARPFFCVSVRARKWKIGRVEVNLSSPERAFSCPKLPQFQEWAFKIFWISQAIAL